MGNENRIQSMIRTARECFDPEGFYSVDHSASGDSESLYNYLGGVEGANGILEKLFYPDGRLKIERNRVDLYSLDLDELGEELREIFSDLYKLTDFSLNGIYENGFNQHDVGHIERVSDTTDRILVEAGFGDNKDVRKNGCIAAHGHDLGNIFSRKAHSLISSTMVGELFPRLKENSEQWIRIMTAIQLHDEPVLEFVLSGYKEIYGSQDEVSLEVEYQILRDSFGPEALALIIADKTDVGRKRISDKPRDVEVINQDMHLAVNLLGETKSVGLSADGDRFDWCLSFTPGLSVEERLEHFSRHSNSKNADQAFVPEIFHKRHRDGSVPAPHADSWRQLFMSLYFDRHVLVAKSVFALFPDVDLFTIEVEDSETGELATIPFHKGSLNEDIINYERKYVTYSKRKGK